MLREWKWCSAQFFCLLYERWYIEIGEEYPRFAFATERKGQRLVVVVIVVVMVVVGSGGGGGSGPVLDSGWIFHGLETRRFILLLRSGPSLLLLRSCSFFSLLLFIHHWLYPRIQRVSSCDPWPNQIYLEKWKTFLICYTNNTDRTYSPFSLRFFFLFLYCHRGRL